MADVTVTIGAQDDGSLGSAMQQVKAQMESLISRGEQISKALAKGVIPPGGRKLMGAEDLSALEAYEASLKKVAGSAINTAVAINNVARAQKNVSGGLPVGGPPVAGLGGGGGGLGGIYGGIPAWPPPGLGATGGGGPPPGGPGGGGAGFQTMAQGANQAAAAVNNVAQAQNNVAQASSRAGSMVERMFERMVIRAGIAAVIFGTIHEILKGLGEAISFEKAETQFQYLIGSGQKFEQQLKGINQEFEVTHTAKDKLMDVEKALYRLGDPVQNLSADMQMLDQYAKVTGEDAGKLVHGLTDLRLGRASIDEMYQMTALMGEQGQGLHDQIASYQRIEAELPNIQREQELNLRLQEHQWQLADRQRDATNRLTDAQGDFAGQVGITKTLFEAMQRGASAMAYAHAAGQVGGVNLEKAAQAEGKRLEMGEQQIQQEEGLSQAQVKSLERQGLINAKTLEGAAERRRADQERAQQQQREDQRFAVQIGMEMLRFQLEQQNLALQGQVLEGLQSFVGLSEGLTKNLQTAAAAFEQLGADIAKIAKEMPGLAQSLAHLAEELDAILKGLPKVPDQIQKTANKAKEAVKEFTEESKVLPEAPYGGEQPWEDKEAREKEREAARSPAMKEEHEELRQQRSLSGMMNFLKSAYAGGGVQATPQEEFELGKKVLMAQGVNRPESDYTAAQIRAAGHKELAKESGIATEDTQLDIRNFLKSLFTISGGP